MASNFNKVLLMGNLTRDVELKYTQSNMAVGNFGLATNRRFTGADGQIREEVMFVDCEAWGKTAESMSKFFTKGRPVFIEGRLKLDTWQDKNDGSKRSKHKVVVENFHFVDSKPGGGDGGGGGHSSGGGYADEGAPSPSYRPAGQPTQGAGPSQPTADPGYEPIQEDDIPF